MIHSETPFWLDSLFYVAYLLPIFIIRYFYYAKGIRFALINMIVDIIAI